MTLATNEIHLVKRPLGRPSLTDFQIVGRTLSDPSVGEMTVRNVALSVDPAMRPRMNDVPSYIPPYNLGEPLDGSAVGFVVQSESSGFPVGTWVTHRKGWREHAVLRENDVQAISRGDFPSTYHLGVLGMPGLTAFVGLFRVACMEEGDVVYVSGAAGAVGGLAGQFAKFRGASHVIGSTGSVDKVEYLMNECGFDAAFNYRDGDIQKQLQRLSPSGFDLYFDNVGGEHLAAAMEVIRNYGRIVLCGMISGYNDLQPTPFQGNLFRIISKRLRLEGFIVSDHRDLWSEFEQQVGSWLTEGRLHYRETVADGLAEMPAAFIEMLAGGSTGKAVVRLRPDQQSIGDLKAG